MLVSSISCCFTLVITSCFPQSSAVRRSPTTSVGAVSLVVNDTRGMSSPSHCLHLLLQPGNIKSCQLCGNLLHVCGMLHPGWKTIRAGESGLFLIIFHVEERSCPVSRDPFDHVTQNLDLVSSVLIMLNMPLCTLFCSSTRLPDHDCLG